MEKLDEIMRAEEAARHAQVRAREHARDIRKEAAAESELILSAGVREAEEEAAHLRADMLRDADARAAEEERAAESRLVKVVQRAEASFDDAVEAVVRLVGQ